MADVSDLGSIAIQNRDRDEREEPVEGVELGRVAFELRQAGDTQPDLNKQQDLSDRNTHPEGTALKLLLVVGRECPHTNDAVGEDDDPRQYDMGVCDHGGCSTTRLLEE